MFAFTAPISIRTTNPRRIGARCSHRLNTVAVIAPNPGVGATPSMAPGMTRREQANAVRDAARDSAALINETSVSNNEENTIPSLIANFTKGLRHADDGTIADPADYQQWVAAVNSGDVDEIAALPLGPIEIDGVKQWRSPEARTGLNGGPVKARGWESMSAGLAFNLLGPDPQSVAMPPVPAINSAEVIAEMGELYLMALARDITISEWNTNPVIADYIQKLNSLSWFADPNQATATEAEALRRRGNFTPDSVFRGILPGSTKGPYLSQFLIQGSTQIGANNAADRDNGLIQYGAITIDSRVRIADEGKDYMTEKQTFLDVQDGADLRGFETYQPGARRIRTLRDLATYVHFDALYEAYLNACLIMLRDPELEFDPGLPFSRDDHEDKQEGFALFGGPHILTLVTEVATRALKAVRYQKFNIHRRARPEAVGGYLNELKLTGADTFAPLQPMADELAQILDDVKQHNELQNTTFGRGDGGTSFLLPMAFAEGSPNHASYGSGHATVAGACVTVLKAFFNENSVIQNVFEVDANGNLQSVTLPPGVELTVGSELEKLADNISIGRDAAGVHWFSDQQESLLLGEQIAIQILTEAKLTHIEDFVWTLTKFNGEQITI